MLRGQILNGFAMKFIEEPESTGDPLKFLSKGISCLNCNFRKIALSLGGRWIGEQGER